MPQRARPTLQRPKSRAVRLLAVLATLPWLGGCGLLVLDPPGDIAAQQGDLIIVATLLMLIVIVPVIALTLLFAWRYRASNTKATYKPNWDHSIHLELVIWAVPMLIIIALGAITWISTHLLDPYRPLERISEGRPVPVGVEPLEIQAVALDWKWVFLYPEQGIATVNEVAVPVDRPVRFKLTASTVMNAFYVPALAGMIYSMPGMETTLHAVMNEAGDYEGFSSHYSGAGFSDMRFTFKARDDAGFEQWVGEVRDSAVTLDRDVYLHLEKPSAPEPVQHYGSVAPGLYHAILNRCVDTDRMCMDQMMAIDAAGGMGAESKALIARTRGDLRGRPLVPSDVCTADNAPLFARLEP